MTSTVDTVLLDVESAIQAAETTLPTVLGIVGAFYAPAKALLPFLPFLQVALNTVQQVQATLDGNTAAAVQSVTTTLQGIAPTTQVAS